MLRLRESVVHLPGITAERARRETGIAVLFLDNVWDPMRFCECQRDAGSIASRPHHTGWPLGANDRREPAPGCHAAPNRLPVFPWPRPVKRVKIEELVRELGCRKNVALDSAPGSYEERNYLRGEPGDRPGNREAWIQMPARPSASEKNPQLRPRSWRTTGQWPASR